jgi:Na+-translocating ferredoxin:NAD+ oxidoreductase RnfA subunit
MKVLPLVSFMIFSGLSMNLMLQCGMGLSNAASAKKMSKELALIQTGIIFTAVVLLWVVFAKIISSVVSGIYIFVLLFPASFLVYDGLESLTLRWLLKREMESEFPISFSGGITAAAVFISLTTAKGFIEAVALSFGFASGVLLAFLILGEIRLRASLEAVPRFLRGKPLTLISMGLLSLIFFKVSLLLFSMIGG